MRKKYDLEDRLVDFAALIIVFIKQMPSDKVGQVLSGQIIRSGTSPALNYGEAQAAESTKDFIHKMKICLKELRESFVCIKIIEKTGITQDQQMLLKVKDECNQLISIFVKSIKTAEQKKK